MLKSASYVGLFGLLVAVLGVVMLTRGYMIGPVIILLSAIPFTGLLLSGRRFQSALPDVIFGTIDTGLLTIPALLGGELFGVAGAIAGGVVGDAITDAIAGFFEGGVAKWLRERGIEESREPVTTALGKMAGCLLGSGVILTLALAFGVKVRFE